MKNEIGTNKPIGYKAITVIKLLNGVGAYHSGKLSFKALRVYMACYELEAIREAAKRSSRLKLGKSNDWIRYERKELVKLTGGLTLRSIGKSLKELERASVMKFSKDKIIFTETPIPESRGLLENALSGRKRDRGGTRSIPVPRRMLKTLASMNKPSLFLTIIAYMIRGLSIKRNTSQLNSINAKGTVKASWIAEVFEISLRAVKSARAQMVSMGLIDRDTGSYQRKLNRDGSYFELNLSWNEASKVENKPLAEKVSPIEENTVSNFLTPETELAPPRAKNCTKFAPPYKKLKTSKENKNQKTWESKPTGVCKREKIKRKNIKNLKAPCLWNIIPDDFRVFSRNQKLFFQAQARGLISGSEADILNWISASVRARNFENAGAIFMGIIKKKLFTHITQAQEDEALRILKKKRAKNPNAYISDSHSDLLSTKGNKNQQSQKAKSDLAQIIESIAA